MVGAGLVPARIARRAMTVIALTRDSGSHKGCPYIFARLCNSPGFTSPVLAKNFGFLKTLSMWSFIRKDSSDCRMPVFHP